MSVLYERLRRAGRRLALSWVAVVVAAIVVGALLSPFAFSYGASPGGTVAVVPIEGGIDGPNSAGVMAMLQRARADPDIEAVVLLSNSPGGGAAASERLYLEVARTAARMPVVSSVDTMAASGAYYAIAPSDHIYAKPSSLVGSVGVFTTAPSEIQPIDQIIASGPKKLSAGDRRDWTYKVESLRRAFVGAVFESRGDALELSRADLSDANLYVGADAVQNGMADDVGGLSDAIRKAAALAGLSSYDVEVLRADGPVRFLSRSNYVASDAADKRLVSPTYFIGDVGEAAATPNIVMLPPSVVAAAIDDAGGTPTGTPANASVAGGDP